MLLQAGPYDANKPNESPFNWSNRALFLRDIYLDQSITALGEQLVALGLQLTTLANQSVPQATTTAQGVVELLTQIEARQGVDNERVPTIALILDFLRHGTGAGATTTRKGTVELATFVEAQQGNATNLVLSVAAALSQLRAPIAQAKENQRGTAFRATKAQAEGGTDDEAMMTAKKTEQHFDNKVWIGTQAQFNALTSKPAGRLHFIT